MSVSIVCETCGKEVTQTDRQSILYKHHYCSKGCMGIAFRKLYLWKEHNCLTCGQPIMTRGGHFRRYCSFECSVRARRKVNAKWRNAEYIKKYMAEYAKIHREELNYKARERFKEKPEVYRAIKRRWVKAHPDAVVLLNYYRYSIKSNGKVTEQDWQDIKERYDYRCAKCQKREPVVKLEIDHIMPLSKGGQHEKINIQPLCRSCNASKNDTARIYRLC